MMDNQAIKLTISSVKRIQGKAVLSLSDGQTLVMPRAMLKERPYRAGMPFDSAQFHAFLAERSFPFALEKAIALLASRARTEREIVDALTRNAYPESTIARVMARLQEAGYTDDAAFSEQWVSSRAAKGLGPRRIRQELLHKGISSCEIGRALDAADEDEMLENAVRMAKKAAAGKDLSDYADRQKVIAALARRGYDFSLAKQALQQIMNQEEPGELQR